MTRTRQSRGITLIELMVTIGVLALVMTLLAFPIFSAFGYIQKATARADAQRAGHRAMQGLLREVETANYVFDIPVDGSELSLTHELSSTRPNAPSDAETAHGLGMALDPGDPASGTAGQVRVERYGLMPAFPWSWVSISSTTGYWKPLAPNYQNTIGSATVADIYSYVYHPFHSAARGAGTNNPYFLAHITSPAEGWASALIFATDGLYPAADAPSAPYPLRADRYTALYNDRGNQGLLQRQLRNDVVAMTPIGSDFDTVRFQATPLRVQSEALVAQGSTGSAALVYLARHPLWCGRNQDIDLLLNQASPRAADFLALYHASSATVDTLVRRWAPLYPVRVNGATPAALGTTLNPYGYQLRVFDARGKVVYGTYFDTSDPSKSNWRTVPALTSTGAMRHYMDWPMIDRPGLLTDGTTSGIVDLATWDADDIAAHRLAGKVIFAQPVAPKELTFDTPTTAGTAVTLPIPDAATWDPAITYLVAAPQRITLKQGTTTRVFTRSTATDPTALRSTEFCLLAPGATTAASREIAFGRDMSGTWTVDYGGQASKCLYTIADLQPGDTVVATYSTRAVLDLVLTVSKRDNAGGTPAQSRQDYTIKTRVEARNAVKRARPDL
jgi:type II secretory pathway pseudopilin PulG